MEATCYNRIRNSHVVRNHIIIDLGLDKLCSIQYNGNIK